MYAYRLSHILFCLINMSIVNCDFLRYVALLLRSLNSEMKVTKAMLQPDRRPAVTIGLPVFNGERYVADAIQSLLNQDFDDFEVIIADNASSDRTWAICKRFAAIDDRIRIYRHDTNLGAARNYNFVVDHARGRYFKWAAHDDRCRSDFLGNCVKVLDRDSKAVIAYPESYVIDEHGNVLAEYNDHLSLSKETPHERLSAYLRRNFIGRQGLCNPIFGVVRSAELKKTKLIQNFLGSDLILLGHLSLLGCFTEVPGRSFERRVHRGISTFANRSFSDRLAWFNPSARKKGSGRFNNHLAQRLTHLRSLFLAVNELVDDRQERRRCRAVILGVACAKPKWIYRDIKYSLGFGPTAGQIFDSLRGH